MIGVKLEYKTHSYGREEMAEGYILRLDAFFTISDPSIPAYLNDRTTPLAKLYTDTGVSIKSDQSSHTEGNLLTEHSVTNIRVAYCGSLKSSGQSGNPKTFERADFQIDTDERLMRMERRPLVVRATRKRSRGSNRPNI